MMKKVYRYFMGFLDAEEKWLNKMASDGYRLIRTSKLVYVFETCQKSEYEYRIEFVADKSHEEIIEYRNFLEDLGFHTLNKNLNLNYSIGKMKWRPWAKGMGQLVTSPGSYNKEILILEKKHDEKPFEVHTDLNDRIHYYKEQRNMFGFTSILLIFLILFGRAYSSSLEIYTTWIKVIVAALCAFFIYLTVRFSFQVHKCKEKRKTNEY